MGTTLQAKELLRCHITIWCTSLPPLRRARRIPGARGAVDMGWRGLGTIPAWRVEKSQEQKGGKKIEAERDKKKVHFATLTDICHLKNVELESKLQKYKGRVVPRCDIVEDDSGAYAVFTEQGSSASQMTAAEVMDVMARPPDCDGHAADAVSACTQVKMGDGPKFVRIPKS